jgi:hypothetical protein
MMGWMAPLAASMCQAGVLANHQQQGAIHIARADEVIE